MKQNELIVSAHRRQSTRDELDHLRRLLKGEMSPRKRYLKAILNSLVAWAGLLILAMLLSGVLGYFAQRNTALASLLALPGLTFIVVVSTAIYALLNSYRWLHKMGNQYPDIVRDIEIQEVVEECYCVQQVIRFQEPTLGGFIYFLKISECHTFVLYDYQSQHNNNHLFPLKTQLTIYRAPYSDHLLGHHFSGEENTVVASYPLTIPPKQWPLDNHWISVPWSQLVLTYSTA